MYFHFLTEKDNLTFWEALGSKTFSFGYFFIRLKKKTRKTPFQLCWKFPLKIYLWTLITFLLHWKIAWLHSLYPMACQCKSKNSFVGHHHGEKMASLAWHNTASIIAALSHPCLSIAQELGGVVAKWETLFSTESLWDTQVGHQGVRENQKNKGMRPLLPPHPPIAGLSNQSPEWASGWRLWGLDKRRNRRAESNITENGSN